MLHLPAWLLLSILRLLLCSHVGCADHLCADHQPVEEARAARNFRAYSGVHNPCKILFGAILAQRRPVLARQGEPELVAALDIVLDGRPRQEQLAEEPRRAAEPPCPQAQHFGAIGQVAAATELNAAAGWCLDRMH